MSVGIINTTTHSTLMSKTADNIHRTTTVHICKTTATHVYQNNYNFNPHIHKKRTAVRFDKHCSSVMLNTEAHVCKTVWTAHAKRTTVHFCQTIKLTHVKLLQLTYVNENAYGEHNSVHQVYNKKIRLQHTNRTSNTTIPYQLQHPEGTMHHPRPHPFQSHRRTLCAHHKQQHQSTSIEQTKN